MEVRTKGPPTFLRMKISDSKVAHIKKNHSKRIDGKRHTIVVGMYGTRLYPYREINSMSDNGTLISFKAKDSNSGSANV